ncbi:hypothetical protein FRC12_023614, partial [Ceratobasidium sp. 428]
MQRGGRLRNDSALRALCEGLEGEIFGPGGYDEFIAGVVRNIHDSNETHYAEHNNAGSGRTLPK